MEKTRILHLLTSLGAGGAETNLLALLSHFDHDHYIHAVAFGGEGGALEHEYESAGLEFIRLSPQTLSWSSILSAPVMTSKIRQFSPDIIHSHLDLPNLVGLIAKLSLKTPLILHLHGLGILPFRDLPDRSRKQIIWNTVARAYRYADRVIAICNMQIPYLHRMGISDQQIRMVPNGIDTKHLQRHKKNNSNRYTFINIGRFYPQKDHELLINAFAKIVNDNPSTRLLLVGDGPLRASTENLVASLGLNNNVEFLGVRRDIDSLLLASDCFVLSSRWELHPITILEAMRASLPVIATAVGGVGDTINDGETGILISPHNEKELVDAMCDLVSHQEKGRRMGAAGNLVVNSEFSNAEVARRIEHIYDELVIRRMEL